MFYLLYACVQIRVGVAILIFLFSIVDIQNRNFTIFFLKILIAVLFHYSAVIFFLFYFLKSSSLNKIFYFLLPFFGILIGLRSVQVLNIVSYMVNFLSSFLSVKILHSLELINAGYFIPLSIVSGAALYKMALYFILFFTFSNERNNYIVICLKIYGWSIFIMYALMSASIFSSRLSEMLTIVLIPLLGNMANNFKQTKSVYFFVVLLSCLMFVYYYIGLLNR